MGQNIKRILKEMTDKFSILIITLSVSEIIIPGNCQKLVG